MEFGDYQLIMPGFLEVYCGPMKSGKTKALLDRVDKVSILESDRYIFFKPQIAKRDFESRSTARNVEWNLIPEGNPYALLAMTTQEHKMVLIDEVQFFDMSGTSASGIVSVVHKLLEDRKNVIIGGLDLDFRGEPFKEMAYL